MANNSDDKGGGGVESFCKSILYTELESVSIRLWDILILVPNLVFLVFLCVLFQRARLKLYATNSPVFLCFYGLIWVCAIFSVLRSVIAMSLSSVNIAPAVEEIVNKILWTVVRFVLLTAEISVLIFSLAFGHLESRHSIRAVLITTGIISLVFSVIQGALELLLPNGSFSTEGAELGVFGHGGVYFLLATSIIFMLIYLAVYLMPYTRISNVILIPVKPSFYRYALVLFCACLSVTVGCILILTSFSFNQCGYCFINFSHYLYFTFFTPLVYLIFLNDYCYNPTKIPFSYTMNESMYEDNVNSIESINTQPDDDEPSYMHYHQAPIVGGSGGGSSCQRDLLTNPNNFVLNGPVHHHHHTAGDSPDQVHYHQFLYNTNIQSPGSMTGYSSVEESTTATVSAHGSMEFIQQQQQPSGLGASAK